MAAGSSRVEIGFLEKSESWKLESRFFPSKVGGRPAWLNLKDINVDVACRQCSKPCVFLCQLYAPLTDRDETYHRTIFIFICRDPECCKQNDNRNFRVYRCQLGRENEFYSPEEPEDRADWCPEAKTEKYSRTCVVCGCFAPSQCGNCKNVKYCSREHQTIDWKAGHKEKCGSFTETSANILFPEFEIVNESEIMDEEDEEMLRKPEEKSEEEKIKEYEEYISQLKEGTLGNFDQKMMEEMAFGKEDKYFKKFKERLKICPDQVLRYDRSGTPLWISEPKFSDGDILNCELCGLSRSFEFQILPTLLNSLNVDSLTKSIDWGTLLVYTCRNSCDFGPAYKEEILLKQDIEE